MYEYETPRTAEEIEAAMKKEAEFRVRREKIGLMKEDTIDRLYKFIVDVSDNPDATDHQKATMVKAAEILLGGYI